MGRYSDLLLVLQAVMVSSRLPVDLLRLVVRGPARGLFCSVGAVRAALPDPCDTARVVSILGRSELLFTGVRIFIWGVFVQALLVRVSRSDHGPP